MTDAASRAFTSTSARDDNLDSKLRIGLLIDSLQLKAWQHAMVKTLHGSDYAEVCVVMLAGGGRRTRKGVAQWLSDAYEFLERKGAREPDALVPMDATDLLGGLPVLASTASGRDGARRLVPEDFPQLGSYGLHALINLSDARPTGDWFSVVQCGVWSVFHGDEHLGFGEPPAFWEVHLAHPITVSGVQIAGRHEENSPTVLCRSFCRTNPFSVTLTNNAIYWKIASLLPRKLEQLRRVGTAQFLNNAHTQSTEPHSFDHPRYGTPNPARVALHTALSLKRRIADLVMRAITRRPWILLYNIADDLSIHISRFSKLVAPGDRYWADPFVVAKNDKFYVFVEEVMNATGKGHISVLVMDRTGRYEGPSPVLKRDYHLSYPFVFEHEGAMYMVPESSANRTVELYRCAEFPGKWEFVRNLLEDIYAVDSTLLWHDGKWWLFANVVEHAGASGWEDLFLFHSDSLGGKWTSHPQNPIVSDVRRSRPAGAILRRGGRLYRPGQDCSVRYGYAIRLNRITQLTEDAYAETEVAAITPSWDKRIVGTHTINHAGGVTMIDALQPRLRI